MLLINQDLRIDHENWDLVSTIGRHKPELYTSTRDIIRDVSSGKLAIAYNIIGSYAFQRARDDPAFGVIVPAEYTLMMSRVAIIARRARHPIAAERLLNFLLSSHGQRLISERGMSPIRSDVPQPHPELSGSNIRAIRAGPAPLANLDSRNRKRFIDQWNETVEPH